MKLPENLLDRMAEAGIVGRGGASFPTHLKWKRLKELKSARTYVVCNASEGEPGVLKDGFILEHFPAQVIDGMCAAMTFLGSREAYFNINENYYNRYGAELERIARETGQIKGYEFRFFIEKPSYIGGETGALLNAIEGNRTQPRRSPPSPSIAGIDGVPTLVDNVETFYDIARLIGGTFTPTRFVTVTGPVANPGVFELDRDSTVLAALNATCNVPEFPYFVQVGGSASGEVIASEQAEGYKLNGCGSIELYRADTPVYDMLRRWINFYYAESCGKCAPCREGTFGLHEAMEQPGAESHVPWGLIQKTLRQMKTSSFCDLGRSLPVAVESYMRNILGMVVRITVDGRELLAMAGKTALQVLIENDLYLAHFCYHEDLEPEANCRTCMVRIVAPGIGMTEKSGDLAPACTLTISDGLVVDSVSPHVRELRRDNQQTLLSHQISWGDTPSPSHAIRDAIENDGIDLWASRANPSRVPVFSMGPSIEVDPNVCISCNLCVRACSSMGIGYLKLRGTGVANRVNKTADPLVDCIYCGQCSLICPVGAIREQTHLEGVKKAIRDPSKVVIVQMAPAVRVSVGEAFGMPPGVNLEKKVNAALRRLGFDRVFDVNWGADVTTIVEAEELVERLQSKSGLPMFTSCCPAWVRYLETREPDFLPYLTSSRSPQIHAGAAYKTWWAKRESIDPDRIVVVSIMPCTSKKSEAGLRKLNVDGRAPVDYVLTTRELATFIEERGIDFDYLVPEEADSLATYSGAAALYGASGGVMEAALRTAAWLVLGEDLASVDFREVRGVAGIKKTQVRIGDRFLNVAVVSTIANARAVLDEIRLNPKAYDYVEFMACPGGCMGGGGQPKPSNARVVKQRMEGLYRIDSSKQVRLAHRNELAMSFVDYCHSKGKDRARELLYTEYGDE